MLKARYPQGNGPFRFAALLLWRHTSAAICPLAGLSDTQAPPCVQNSLFVNGFCCPAPGKPVHATRRSGVV